MIEIICKHCGKRILTYPYRRFRQKYCSKKCQYTDRKNYHPSEETREKMSISLKKIAIFNKGCFKKGIVAYPNKIMPKKDKHWHWKGGRTKTVAGYMWIYQPKHPCANHGYIYEHRFIMEKCLGRYLKPKEVVHHINKVKDDNRIQNLRLFKNESDHRKFHRKK